MIKRKPHIDETTYRRYLNDEMTKAERNAFEKELQKDPFAAEALEGFELFSAKNLKKDLNDLKSRILTPKKKKRTSYYAAAATILLLVTAGVIWMELEKQDPVPQMTETKIEPAIKTEEPAEQLLQDKTEKSAPIVDEKEKDAGIEENTALTAKREIKIERRTVTPKSASKVQEEVFVAKAIDVEPITFEMADEELELDEIIYAAPAANSKTRSKTLKSIVQGTVVSADDQLPVAGATIVEKGTENGVITDLDGQFKMELNNDSTSTLIASFIGMESNEFKPNKDSNNTVELESDELDLNEVVVVGYGTQQKKNVTGSATVVDAESQNSEATPIGGYQNYYKYLEKNAMLPVDFTAKKLVVKLKVELDANGNIIRITNANKADKKFFNKAKVLVENGPGWQPEYFNNRKVKSQVKLRIVYRKPEK